MQASCSQGLRAQPHSWLHRENTRAGSLGHCSAGNSLRRQQLPSGLAPGNSFLCCAEVSSPEHSVMHSSACMYLFLVCQMEAGSASNNTSAIQRAVVQCHRQIKHLSVTQAGSDAPPGTIELPPLDTEAAEVQWVADAISLWLDEEWLPQDIHQELGKAAGHVRPRLQPHRSLENWSSTALLKAIRHDTLLLKVLQPATSSRFV